MLWPEPFKIEHCYMGLTNRASYEMLACFICVLKMVVGLFRLRCFRVRLCTSVLWGKGKGISLESSRMGWYHRYKLIRASKPREMEEAITIDTLCFCLFEFGESRCKWVQVLATSVLCASIKCAQMACNWCYFNFINNNNKIWISIYLIFIGWLHAIIR